MDSKQVIISDVVTAAIAAIGKSAVREITANTPLTTAMWHVAAAQDVIGLIEPIDESYCIMRAITFALTNMEKEEKWIAETAVKEFAAILDNNIRITKNLPSLRIVGNMLGELWNVLDDMPDNEND